MIKTIPLAKLVPSPRNVRRSSDPQADAELKADIAARGLLQNLVVTSVKKPKGCFAVEAGGRRLRALQELAQEGLVDSGHEVSCLVLDGDAAAAAEASLAENVQRLAMNPADECLAFSQLIEQGADSEGVARRFGLTVRFVEGRLRLAGLAPAVFEALGAGEISLDVAKAYAATPARERQVHVFEQMSRSYMGQHPDSIRRMMTQATVSASDRRAHFVGEEAYVAAGGRVERDLFSEDDQARWLDIALLERLAVEKLEAAAAEVAASSGFAFVRPTLQDWIGHDLTRGLVRVRLEPAAPGEEERQEADALQAEYDDIASRLDEDDLDAETSDALQARAREIAVRIDAIHDNPQLIPDELKPRLGTFLMLDEQGVPILCGNYYEEPAPVGDIGTGAEGVGGGGAGNEGGGGTSGSASVGASGAGGAEQLPKNGGLSQALVDELAIQRRDILAVHIAADPALALDLTIFLMIDGESGYSREQSGSSLVAMPPSDPVFGFKTPNARATIVVGEAREALDRSWTQLPTRGERLDAFRALPDEARQAWVGHAVARTLEASLNLPGQRCRPFHDHLGQLLGIDVAQWWRPTGTNYFDRVPKSVTLAALEEVGGGSLSGRYAKSKKAELCQAAERVFAGDFVAEVEVKQAALAWVPEAMRFRAHVGGESDAEGGAETDDDSPPWDVDEPEAADGGVTSEQGPEDAASGPAGEAGAADVGDESGGSEGKLPPPEREEVVEAA